MHVFLGLGFVTAVGFQAIGPGRQEVPARAATGLGVGGNDFDAIFGQVAPVLDVLGVALAHQEHDGRGVRGAGIGQACLPIFGDALAQLADFVDVTGQSEGHHVGTQPIDHGPRLLARATMGLLDLDVVFGVRLLPEVGELGVEFLVQLTGRIVGDIEQFNVLGNGGTGKYSTGKSGQGITANGHGEAPERGVFLIVFLALQARIRA
ncbi:hypothetical protein D3C84_405190 [compost metagenome]